MASLRWRVGPPEACYGEAADPTSDENEGPFFVYDIARGDVVFESAEVAHAGFRNVMVDGEGTAYFSAGDAQLNAYDPQSGELRTLASRMPGATLRASTRPHLTAPSTGSPRTPRCSSHSGQEA